MKEDAALKLARKACGAKYRYLSVEFLELAKVMEGVGNISNLMKLKVHGMIIALDMPLSTSYCPFCKIADDGNALHCGTCWYGETHGGECDEEESVYFKILALQAELKICIREYWTHGNSISWDGYSGRLREAENPTYYKAGDLLNLQVLDGSTSYKRKVVVVNMGNKVIKLCNLNYEGYFSDKEVRVNDLSKITSYEISKLLCGDYIIELLTQ